MTNNKPDYGENKLYLFEDPYLTVNGEGDCIGMPAVFVRVPGCNVGCVWCDAMSTWPKSKGGKPLGLEYTNASLTTFLDENFPNTPRIWLTGGEPTESAEVLWSFVKYYKKYGAKERIFHLITAGWNFVPKLMYEMDKIVIDMKPPSSKTASKDDFIAFAMEDKQITWKVEFKCVVSKTADDMNFALRVISLAKQFNRPVTIQPLYWSEAQAKDELKTGQTVQNLKVFNEQFQLPATWASYAEFAEQFMGVVKYENVRILPQLHKIYWPGELNHI